MSSSAGKRLPAFARLGVVIAISLGDRSPEGFAVATDGADSAYFRASHATVDRCQAQQRLASLLTACTAVVAGSPTGTIMAAPFGVCTMMVRRKAN